MTRRRSLFSPWLLLALAAFSVCGGIAACKADAATASATACEHSYTNCANDPPPSTQDLSDCTQALMGPCGDLMQLYVACVTGKCSDAGHVDHSAIDALCATQLQAYRNCALADAGAVGMADTGVSDDASAGSDTAVGDDTGAGGDTGTGADAGVDADGGVDADAGGLEAGD
jgi:hypothetical protein